MSTEGGMKAVVAALCANLGIAVSKFVAFAITGSASMLSEAIHSVADSCNQVLLLIGNRRSKRASDETHQFGFGRLRYVYGFMVAIVLFLVGGLYSLIEGSHKIREPEELNSVGVAIAVLLVAIALESFSLRTALGESNKSRGHRSLFRFVRETRNPELPVILLEDIGALVGLCFALIGVSMSVITGDARWDGLGACAVGTLLIIIAIFLAIEMTSMLTGESALPEENAAIRSCIEQTEGVERLIHMRTLHVGPDEILVAAKISVPGGATTEQISATINAAEASLREAVPGKTCVVYLEPDVYEAQHLAPGQSATTPVPEDHH